MKFILLFCNQESNLQYRLDSNLWYCWSKCQCRVTLLGITRFPVRGGFILLPSLRESISLYQLVLQKLPFQSGLQQLLFNLISLSLCGWEIQAELCHGAGVNCWPPSEILWLVFGMKGGDQAKCLSLSQKLAQEC